MKKLLGTLVLGFCIIFCSNSFSATNEPSKVMDQVKALGVFTEPSKYPEGMVEFFGKEDGNAAGIEFDVIRKPADGELAERVFPTTFNVDLFPKKAKASWTNAEILALIEELKSINDVETRLAARLLHVTQAEVEENTTL